MVLHALANCCKDSIIGRLEKYSVNCIRISGQRIFFGTILVVIVCR